MDTVATQLVGLFGAGSGVSTWFFYGRAQAKNDGKSTYSRELWQSADDRKEMSDGLWQRVTR